MADTSLAREKAVMMTERISSNHGDERGLRTGGMNFRPTLAPFRTDPARRTTLKVLGVATLWGLTRCCLPPPGPSPVTASGSTTIDVHCHVFNARDLPIEGFVSDVVLADYQVLKLPTAPLVWLLTLVLDAQAIAAADEVKQIRAGQPARLADFQRNAARTLSFAPAQGRIAVPVQTDEDLVRQRIIDAVTRMQNQDQGAAARRQTVRRLVPGAAPEAGDDEATLFGILAARKPGQERLAQPGGASERSALPAIQRVTPSEVADGVVAAKDAIYGTFLMGALLTRPRAELTDRIARLPSSNAADVSFFAPAIIDYSYWLNTQDGPGSALDVSPLEDQVDVMSAIAAMKQNSAAVHPWVSFCPWRQIDEEKQLANSGFIIEPGGRRRTMAQLAIIQDAVMNKGFVGVKLYPVMGFRPYGNNGAPDPESYPASLRDVHNWGAALDGALGALYDWCIANDVPIMAHCSFSQYPSKAAGGHGSPDAWQLVFAQSKWKTLRVNLGHLGGLWDLVTDDGTAPDGWTEKVVTMLADKNLPNLYGDVADYDRILERSNNDDEQALDVRTLDRLRDLLTAQPAARAKLMYGTDWVMLARCGAAENYYPSMKQRIPERLNLNTSEMRGFLGFNAARFLGLAVDSAGRKPATRTRLEEFRRKQGLDIMQQQATQPRPAAQHRVSGADRARRGVRRHRHQPALRLLDRAQRHRPSGADTGRRHGHRLAHFLGADADGVGQIRALRAARRQRRRGRHPGAAVAGRGRPVDRPAISLPMLLGILGAALLYGDGVITPAISVLSAMEGLKLAAPGFQSFILPVTLAILVGLFAIQRQGTHQIGRLFGPVMVVWFWSSGARRHQYRRRARRSRRAQPARRGAVLTGIRPSRRRCSAPSSWR
jgi:predicted TIM-barrel fold metal-dependent hydrolase